MGAHNSKDKLSRSYSERYIHTQVIERERFGSFGKRAKGKCFPVIVPLINNDKTSELPKSNGFNFYCHFYMLIYILKKYKMTSWLTYLNKQILSNKLFYTVCSWLTRCGCKNKSFLFDNEQKTPYKKISDGS